MQHQFSGVISTSAAASFFIFFYNNDNDAEAYKHGFTLDIKWKPPVSGLT